MSRRSRYSLGTEGGFSLLEVMLAITLLGIIVVGLAGLGLDISRRSIDSSQETYKVGIVAEQVSRIAALPFDSLPAVAGCVTETAQPFPHQRCITVTDNAFNERSVQLVVTPTDTNYAPDTVVIARTNPLKGNPLNSP